MIIQTKGCRKNDFDFDQSSREGFKLLAREGFKLPAFHFG